MIIAFFESEFYLSAARPRARPRWNSEFCTYSFKRWHFIIIIYLTERWVSGKSRFTLNSTHLKKNPSDCKVHVKHQKRLDLFWNLIKNFTRDSTASRWTPYCEVELLRPVAYLQPHKPSLWFSAWSVLDFHSCAYSSEFCIEIVGWVNKDFDILIQAADRMDLLAPFFSIWFRVSLRGKPPIPSACFTL